MPPSTHYIVVATWEDSFEQFALLRDWLVDTMKYDYALILLKQNQPVKTGQSKPEPL